MDDQNADLLVPLHQDKDDDGVVEGFAVVETVEAIRTVELVIVEEYIRTRREIPVALAYRIRVDRSEFDMPKAEVTGEDILRAAGLKPAEWKLYQHKPGRQPEQVRPEQVVDLREHGIERFSTMAKGTTEGRDTLDDLNSPPAPEAQRREFKLPEGDEAYLTSRELPWDTVHVSLAQENQQPTPMLHQCLMIHAWQLPSGYNHTAVSLAFLIPPSYPDSQIDMMYVRPALSRADNRPVGAISNWKIGAELWQRWSRHRTGAHPWRPGVDDVSTHLSLVDDWFRREFGGG